MHRPRSFNRLFLTYTQAFPVAIVENKFLKSATFINLEFIVVKIERKMLFSHFNVDKISFYYILSS